MTASDPSTVCEVVAPVRADLSAGFPDVAPFCRDRPGLVVNVALNLCVRVTIRRERTGDRTAATLPRRLIWWVAEELGLPGPFAVDVATPGLTPGSGLGASGALSVAVVHSLLTWGSDLGAPPPATADVVALAVRAERAAGLYGGTQDQWASACGGVGTVRQFREQGERITFPELPPSLAARLVLVHPGGRRDSGAIVSAVTEERGLPERVAVVREMNAAAQHLESALARDDMDTLAAVVDESCVLLARLHPEIVSSTIREVLRAAPGVKGAKPCGAGGAGATWVVVIDPEARSLVEAALRLMGMAVMDTAPSSVGARRIR